MWQGSNHFAPWSDVRWDAWRAREKKDGILRFCPDCRFTHLVGNHAPERLNTTAAPAESWLPGTKTHCTWTIDDWDEDSGYETSCGQAFVLIDCENLDVHGFHFCVYCGQAIKEVRVNQYEDEDEDA